MEIAALLTAFLSPFFPHLLKLSQPAAEAAGKKLGEKLGEGSWEKAKQVWAKVSPKVEEKPLAKGAVEALAEDSQDEDTKGILAKQLEKLLKANPVIEQALRQLLEADTVVSKVVNISQQVEGDKNVVMGEVSGQVNITQG